MAAPSLQSLITAASGACKSLSRCSNFFNFHRNDSWLGWENRLTVDIVRPLKQAAVVRFGEYANGSKSDITIFGRRPIVTEIKVSFVDESELSRWTKRGSHKLPTRVQSDLEKLAAFPDPAQRVMLLATCFENVRQSTGPYTKLINPYLDSHYAQWKRSWVRCGNIVLLVLVR